MGGEEEQPPPLPPLPLPPSELCALPPETSVRNALILSLGTLEGRGTPEPRECAIHLLLHALGLDWDDSHRQLREAMASSPPPPTRAGRNMPAVGLARRTLLSGKCLLYLSLLKRRARFEPVQYIMGRWDFHHLLGLRIRRPMLCPRPETEELVELVLSDVGRLIADPNIGGTGGGRGGRRVRVLDVGSLGPPERQGRAGHRAGPRRPWGRLQRSSVSRPWVNNRTARWT